MRVILAVAILAIPAALAARPTGGSHSVNGYVKRDGIYVAPHMQTNPNSTKIDNYSTKGNINPYTGMPGTVDPFAVKRASPPK